MKARGAGLDINASCHRICKLVIIAQILLLVHELLIDLLLEPLSLDGKGQAGRISLRLERKSPCQRVFGWQVRLINGVEMRSLSLLHHFVGQQLKRAVLLVRAPVVCI